MAIKPPMLRSGDTIGIVTLGSPLAAETIDARIATLQSMGFNVVLGQHVYDVDGYLAGTDQERAADLMSMFRNRAVRMILPTRGGVGVAGILPYLDYGYISAHPKIITGYSDITVLLNTLTLYSDLITFHSLLLIDFKPETPAYSFNQFFAATSTLTAPRPILNPPNMPLVGKIPGNVTAPIVGGNLTSMLGTLGTPYEIDTRGKILLIEETHEAINTVYRYLTHMRLAGKFDAVAGIVMGECTGCLVAYGKSYEDLIDETIVPLGKPLLTGLASGHGMYKAAIPIGATVNMRVAAGTGTLTIMEPTVRL